MTIYVRQVFSGAGVGIGDWNIPLVAAPVETATTITINVPLHADIKWGSSNNQLSIEDDTGTVLLENVTFSGSPTATAIVQTGIPDPSKASYHEYAKTDAEVGSFTSEVGDTLVFENQTDLTVDGETVITIDPAADKAGWYKFWDESLGAFTAVSSYEWLDGVTGIVSGTISATTEDDTSAAAGALTTTGTITATNDSDTSAIAGTLTVSGSSSTTTEDDTTVIGGAITLPIAGTIAANNADDTTVISGSVIGDYITPKHNMNIAVENRIMRVAR